MANPMYKIVPAPLLNVFRMDEEMAVSDMSAVAESMLGDSAAYIFSLIVAAKLITLIEKSGNVLVIANEEDWGSDISAKTIEKLKPSDIKLPFRAFSMSIDNKTVLVGRLRDFRGDWAEEAKREGVIPNDGIVVCVKEQDGLHTIYTSYEAKTFGDATANVKNPEMNALYYKVLSAIMYISLFKNDRSRIVEKTRRVKASKKRAIPKHVERIITLSMEAHTENTEIIEGQSKNYSKAWIVRGHWRNQWYSKEGIHKPKWIDPYWKGKGKEVIRKTYKLKNKEKE